MSTVLRDSDSAIVCITFFYVSYFVLVFDILLVIDFSVVYY